MNDWQPVAETSEITDGAVKKVSVGGQDLALINLGGELFAVSDICTHKQCSLSEGFVEGENLVCPCHGSQFKIKTGAVDTPPATEPLKTYEVKVEDGKVLVRG